MSRASALFRLQETDLDLDACRARLAEIARALGGSPAVQAARLQLTEADGQRSAARVALQDLELSNQSLSAKIAEAEGQLYGGKIRNPKELKDLQAEIESLKRRLGSGEEQQLEALIQLETAEAQLAAVQTDLQRAEAEAERVHAALASERAALEAKLGRLADEREAQHTSIPAVDREVYERLRQSKKGRALARMEDGVCVACGVEPSAQIAQAARRGGELARCPSCDRILYAE
jgi:hypothetical protein